MEILKGQRTPITKFLPNTNQAFQIELSITGIPVDFSCFGLNADGKLLRDEYMTFFNQPKMPCGGISLSFANNSATFLCDLNKLPAAVESLSFTAAIDGSQTMNQMQAGYLRFLSNSFEVARFNFSGADFNNEKALMLGDIYRKNGEWRFNAFGQGFNGGLSALLEHFGGEVLEETPQTQPEKPKLSLSKITLEKSGDKISLEKPKQGGYGRIVCNLNWTNEKTKKGFFSKSCGIDLDLACLYELSDGTKLVVQALGNQFGKYETPPYIYLAGDDRTGANTAGEFIYINGDHLKEIKRICVFAFIYEGSPNWQQANAIVTVSVPNHPVIEVKLDASSSNLRMGAIAMIENDNGELKVTKLNKYFQGHKELDKHYRWGLSWTHGSK
ncbi:MAG: TerD family protein [Methylococcales bacterium]|nr:TerD family protein [Methylococcales bacterium]